MEIQLIPYFLAFLGILSMTWYLIPNTPAIGHWPIGGSLPWLLWNSNRLHEWLTEVFSTIHCGSFFIDGGVISKPRYLVTCDPQNLEYILKTNFVNFPKGPDFKEVFDILGDGIFSADNESWRLQRKLAHACFSSVEFRDLVNKVSRKVVEDQLVPLLTHVLKEGSIIDLQDVCKRLAFDTTMETVMGRHETFLSVDFRVNEISNVIDDAQEALSYRLTTPMFLWKFLRLLNVGREKKLAKASKMSDVIFGDAISLARQKLLTGVETFDLLSIVVKSGEKFLKDDKSIRDIMLSFLLGGRDTITSGLTWFLWLVAKTPYVEAKIIDELKLIFMKRIEIEGEGDLRNKRPWVFDSDDLKGLVYLHAAICESLRLYPPLPVNSKGVIKEDVLPDGTVVKPGTQILLSFWSEGRMPWIWGEDSLEFKPERWINDEGKLSNEPLSKFFAFNSGPRTCLGKNMSFTQMKIVIAAILFNFQLELVEGHPVVPKPSINLFMKNGVLVKVRERSI